MYTHNALLLISNIIRKLKMLSMYGKYTLALRMKKECNSIDQLIEDKPTLYKYVKACDIVSYIYNTHVAALCMREAISL